MIGVVFSVIKLQGIYAEYKRGVQSYDHIEEQYTSKNKEPQNKKNTTEEKTSQNQTKETDVIECPYTVNFKELKALNSNIIAWIYFESIDISYPVLQGKDNEYYLYKTADNKENKAGSIFIDCDNAKDFSDQNTIIFGHNMKNLSMFGKLKYYMEKDYFDENAFIWIITPTKSMRYQIFASHIVKAEGDPNYQMTFEDGKSFLEFIRIMRDNSDPVNSDIEIKENSKIISLSTCVGDETKRYMLNAVQIYEEKNY